MIKKHLKKARKILKNIETNYQVVLNELVHMKITYDNMTEHERAMLQLAISQANEMKRSSILALDDLDFLGNDGESDGEQDNEDEPSIHGLLRLNRDSKKTKIK
jgi:hypothetical protein